MTPRSVDSRARNSRRDPETTKREILDAATEEFARHGPRGARTDDIAERTNTTKRMIYYYFGSKDALYACVLRETYTRVRALETHLGLADQEPLDALRALIRATLDHYEKNPHLARIVTMENLVRQGRTLAEMEGIQELNRSALYTLTDVLRRGREAGIFRSDPRAPDALDVHQILSAMALNRVEHRATFRIAFGRDLLGQKDGAHVRELIESTVLRLVLADPTRVDDAATRTATTA
jgi:AcrR family transcriptional regulator